MPVPSRDHIDLIVEQWGRERPDLDVTALAALGRLFRVVDLAGAELAGPLRAHGLDKGWFDLIAALRRAGPPYQLHPTELMATTMLSSGGMTKRIDRLVDAGLVERRPDPRDRRATLVRLSRRGKRTADAALETHIAGEERLLGALSQSERHTLDVLLRKLLQALDGPSHARIPRR
jgi:DNA-binding MarR family transcriptional regulator